MSENAKTPSTPASAGHLTAGEIIRRYQDSTLEDIMDETPAVIAAQIVLLSAKLWEAGSETLRAEQAFNRVWCDMRAQVETDGQTDRKARLSDEYGALKRCQVAEKTVLEVIRALKRLLASKETESRNQY